MTLIDYSSSILAFLVPAVTIILAITTGRVVLSLLVGSILGALMLNGFGLESIGYLWGKFTDIFISDGAIDIWTLNIFLFLILLGGTTAVLTLNGATRAFAEWAHARVKSRQGASLLTVGLGIIIFIDDYFNAIGVGAISRPVTDSFKVSRAKLAYLIDSTAAPMVILTPISSWGGYVIGILGTAFAAHQIDIGPLSAYVQMIPMNFYAILTIALVLYTAATSFDIGPMAEHERRAKEEGILFNPDSELRVDANPIVEGEHGKVYELFVTIGVLIGMTITSLFLTGASALAEKGKAFGWIDAIENADVGLALVYGSGTSLLVALIFSFLKAACKQRDTYGRTQRCRNDERSNDHPYCCLVGGCDHQRSSDRGIYCLFSERTFGLKLSSGIDIYTFCSHGICNGYKLGYVWYHDRYYGRNRCRNRPNANIGFTFCCAFWCGHG